MYVRMIRVEIKEHYFFLAFAFLPSQVDVVKKVN